MLTSIKDGKKNVLTLKHEIPMACLVEAKRFADPDKDDLDLDPDPSILKIPGSVSNPPDPTFEENDKSRFHPTKISIC